MNFLSTIWNSLFGDKKKKEQQPSTPAPSAPISGVNLNPFAGPISLSQNQAPRATPLSRLPTTENQPRPTNSLNLFNINDQLQKASPNPSPRPQVPTQTAVSPQELKKAQDTLNNPFIQAGAAVQHAVENVPQVHFADKMKNPLVKFVASIPQAVINSPHTSFSGAQSLGERIRGDKPATFTGIISDYAKMADLPVNIATLGGGSAVAGAAETGLRSAVKEGAVQGAKYGGIFGGLGGAQQETNDLGEQARNIATGIATGAPTGALFGAAGGTLPTLVKAAGRGATNLLDRFGPPEALQKSQVAAESGVRSINPAAAEDAAIQSVQAATPQPIPLADRNRALNQANTAKTVEETLAGGREQFRLDQPQALQQVASRIGIAPDAHPDTPITVYRAGTGPINPGEFVTTEQANAARYVAQRPGSELNTTTVPLRDLVQSGGLKTEFVYAPKETAPLTAAAEVANPEVLAATASQAQPGPTQGTVDAPMLPPTPQPAPSVPQVPVAPRSHDALVKSLGESVKEQKGQYGQRPLLNLEDLTANATRQIAGMDDNTLLATFQAADPNVLIKDSPSMALSRAALDRLAKQPENPAATQTVVNIMDALDRYKSKSGEALRIAQEEFDKMPLPMKVRYIVKKIDAANRNAKGYVPLAEDPARASLIDTQLSYHLKRSQDIADQVAQIEAKLQDAAEAAVNGQKVADVATLKRQLTTAKRNLAAENGETVKYYQTLLPGRSKAQQALSDLPRTMMLASFTGRVNDVLTTANNVAYLTPRNFVQGVLSKAMNKIKPGLVTDTTKGTGELFKGAIEGARRTGGEIAGTQYVPNLEQSLQKNVEARSGLTKAQSFIPRTIQASVEAATNLSEGVRDQRLYQLADQEAAKLGITGPLREQYASARAAVPSRQMLNAAELLHQQVNNLNANPISQKLTSISSAIGGDSAIGGLLKNQILPFTSWLGGNIWNSVTDKNVVANTVKLIGSLAKGDAEGAVRNLSSAAVGTAEAYGMGYLLSQMNVLSPTNAEGYNDGGLYLHLGDRYIPVGVLGFFAPNIVLGHATYQATHTEDGQNPAAVLADTIGSYAWNGLALGNALGVDNGLSRAYDAATRPGGDVADAAATLGAGVVSQYIPAGTGDVNAVLNNYTDLNPTREAADTRVQSTNILESGKQSTAKDYPASAVAQVENRIPVLSQALPRKEGIAAADLVDRATHGDRDTTTTVAQRNTEQAKVNQEKDFKARDIPYFGKSGFEDAVQARVERGEYGKAIEALQAKLDHDKSDKNVPESKIKDQQNEVKQLTYAQQHDFAGRDIPYFGQTGFKDAVEARVERGEYQKAIEGLQLKLQSDRADENIPETKLKDQQDDITKLEVARDNKIGPNTIEVYKETSLSEWRDMGDPESDNYNPGMYELLWAYDSALAKKGVSRNNTDAGKTFYSAKKPKKGRGAKNLSEGNLIGAVPDLGTIKIGDLSARQTTAPRIPVIARLKPNELVKRRKISVGR